MAFVLCLGAINTAMWLALVASHSCQGRVFKDERGPVVQSFVTEAERNVWELMLERASVDMDADNRSVAAFD